MLYVYTYRASSLEKDVFLETSEASNMFVLKAYIEFTSSCKCYILKRFSTTYAAEEMWGASHAPDDGDIYSGRMI